MKQCIEIQPSSIVGHNTGQNMHLKKNTNKKTVDEKREDSRIRKQQQRENLKSKYGDEEYRKIKAKEIADYRQAKRNNRID